MSSRKGEHFPFWSKIVRTKIMPGVIGIFQSHPDVVRAGVDALAEYGAGLSSVGFICGTQDIHKELERKIS